MTPAEGMDLARQVHARAEAYDVGAWCAAVDVLNSGDEADQRRARELMVFVRQRQMMQGWLDKLPTPAQLAPKDWHAANDQRAPTEPQPTRRISIIHRAIWFAEGAIGAVALFCLLWIALAVLT